MKRRYLASFMVAALLTAAFGSAWASPSEAFKIDENSFSLPEWSLPSYEPVSEGTVEKLQEFLGTNDGILLRAQIPALAIMIERLKPQSMVHRSLVSALGVHNGKGFENLLKRAVKKSGKKERDEVRTQLLNAHRSGGGDRIAKIAQARGRQVLLFLGRDDNKVTPEQLHSAAKELNPVLPYSEKALAVAFLSRGVKSSPSASLAMDTARRIARALENPKNN